MMKGLNTSLIALGVSVSVVSLLTSPEERQKANFLIGVNQFV